MTKKVALLIILFISWMLTYGQHQRYKGKAPKIGVVKGKIVDASTNKPLEYANVAIYSVKDSSLAGGSVTDAKGEFVVKKLTFGKFYVQANFIGYQKRKITSLKINPKRKKHDLGKITLSPASKKLDNVDVVADRNRVEYKIDKKVVNVSQDLTSSGGTAVDALENVPSVQVDIEGNVQLRGSSNFRVLVNGKPTVLSGSDALQQISASTIKEIEIITNPSAKYDPEGTAGIINVITKKNKKQGINGIVNASAGLRDKYSGDFQLNYKAGKFNLFGGANYRDYSRYMNGTMLRETYGDTYSDTTSIIDENSERRMRRKGHSINAGFDYNFSDKTVLSLKAKYGTFGFGWNSETKTHYSEPGDNERYYLTKNNNSIARDYLNMTLSFSHNFPEEKHKLEASAYISQAGIDDSDKNKEYPTDENFEIRDMLDPTKLRTAEGGERLKTRVKIDYTRPLWKGKLEAGYQGRYRNMNEDYTLEQFDPDLTKWNEMEASDIDLHRHVEALYATYSANFGKFGIMAGIRGEYTDRLLKQQTIDEEYRIHRVNFFPSGHISYKLPAKQELQASYSRRLNRPRGWYLDPFEQYQDAYNVRIGNPELEPEYTDSYELNYQKRFGMSFVSLEAFHRFKTNLISRVERMREDGVMEHTFTNVNNDYSSGAELMVNMQFYKWWRLNASASAYRYEIKGTVNDEDISRKSNNWDARLNSTFKLPTNSRIQLMGFYRSPSVTAQGNREGFFFTSVAFKQEFLDRKASVTLNVKDVFGTMKHDMTSEGANYRLERTFQPKSPMVSLQFSYRINNYKDKRKKRDGSEGGEFEGMGQGM